jgi:hypothetical protein
MRNTDGNEVKAAKTTEPAIMPMSNQVQPIEPRPRSLIPVDTVENEALFPIDSVRWLRTQSSPAKHRLQPGTAGVGKVQVDFPWPVSPSCITGCVVPEAADVVASGVADVTAPDRFSLVLASEITLSRSSYLRFVVTLISRGK